MMHNQYEFQFHNVVLGLPMTFSCEGILNVTKK